MMKCEISQCASHLPVASRGGRAASLHRGRVAETGKVVSSSHKIPSLHAARSRFPHPWRGMSGPHVPFVGSDRWDLHERVFFWLGTGSEVPSPAQTRGWGDMACVREPSEPGPWGGVNPCPMDAPQWFPVSASLSSPVAPQWVPSGFSASSSTPQACSQWPAVAP